MSDPRARHAALAQEVEDAAFDDDVLDRPRLTDGAYDALLGELRLLEKPDPSAASARHALGLSASGGRKLTTTGLRPPDTP